MYMLQISHLRRPELKFSNMSDMRGYSGITGPPSQSISLGLPFYSYTDYHVLFFLCVVLDEHHVRYEFTEHRLH